MMTFAILVLLALACSSHGLPTYNAGLNEVRRFTSVFTDAEKQAIVDHNNRLRSQPSQYEGYTASNMMKVEWDDRLEEIAQAYAEKCPGDHSDPEIRDITYNRNFTNGFWSTQENLARSVTMEWATDAFYSEGKNFQYGVGKTGVSAVVGHYTAMLFWANTRIACGMVERTKCSTGYNIACLYASQSNRLVALGQGDHKLFKNGAPCADCPGHCDAGGKLCECDSSKCQIGSLNADCSCTCFPVWDEFTGLWGGSECKVDISKCPEKDNPTCRWNEPDLDYASECRYRTANLGFVGFKECPIFCGVCPGK